MAEALQDTGFENLAEKVKKLQEDIDVLMPSTEEGMWQLQSKINFYSGTPESMPANYRGSNNEGDWNDCEVAMYSDNDVLGVTINRAGNGYRTDYGFRFKVSNTGSKDFGGFLMEFPSVKLNRKFTGYLGMQKRFAALMVCSEDGTVKYHEVLASIGTDGTLYWRVTKPWNTGTFFIVPTKDWIFF